MKIVITGAQGLIGWHAAARLHALNCGARFKGRAEPHELVLLGHSEFETPTTLQAAVRNADAVLHFAGVNRAADDVVKAANPEIAHRLIAACHATGASPHIVYANSIHADSASIYGRSKRIAAEVLAAGAHRFTNLILPNIFGECARPFYNNVTATLIRQLHTGVEPTVNPEGKIRLLYAGDAAQLAIDAVTEGVTGDIAPKGRPITIPDLLKKLQHFHDLYRANIFPDPSDPFDLALFNAYRADSDPDSWQRTLEMNLDERGTLFEAVKGGGGGQVFMSTTNVGVTRGNHFHLHKIERFLVVHGQAMIRIRKVLTDKVWECRVDGATPTPIDMPTLHTHSIENIGDTPLLTLFWTHDLFDPENPETYSDIVLP